MVFTKCDGLSFLISFLLLLLVNASALAQQGNPYIVNYVPDLKNIDNQNLSIVQGADGVLYFANRKGVLSYDGYQWRLIKTASSVFSLVRDTTSGQIYVGCRGNFGLLDKDAAGVISYVSLFEQNESHEQSEITNIITAQDGIYYAGAYVLFRYSGSDQNIDTIWSTKNDKLLRGLFSLKNELYINLDGSGLQKITRSETASVIGGDIFSDVEIITSIPFSNDAILLGTNENEIFLFDGKDIQPFSVEAKEYLLESNLAGGLELSAQQFVLSTLTGGCVIIDKKTGNTVNILNYQTGLPDDEIYAMGTDRNGGLWLTHDYGISRADISVPIRNYSSYPGIEGNLISVVEFDSTIYVSTTEGIYFLTEVKDYSEVVIYIKQPKKKTEAIEPRIENRYVRPHRELTPDKNKEPVEAKSKTQDHTSGEKREGFKLFGYRVTKEKKRKLGLNRKGKTAQVEEPSQEEKAAPTHGQDAAFTRKVPVPKRATKVKDPVDLKKVYALQSIQYVYKLVPGLKDKCQQMVKHENLLLVATNTGLYEITNQEARPIVKDRYINYLTHSNSDPNRFYVATASGLFALYLQEENGSHLKNRQWEFEHSFDSIREAIYSVLEDESNNLWLGCNNSVYHVTMDAGVIPTKYERINFDGGADEPVLVSGLFGKPYFFTAEGIYSYDAASDSIRYEENINDLYPSDSRFMSLQRDITWIHSGKEWSRFNASKDVKTHKETYLSLFDNIQSIYMDQDNNFWVNNHRALHKVLEPISPERKYIFNLELSGLTNDYDQHYALEDELTLKYDNSSLKLHLSAPSYLKDGGALYQYIVEGLMKDWTIWSPDPVISFPFIAAGDYTVNMRAKDTQGNRSAIKTFHFSVSPPFWQSWWFYLIGLVLGGTGLYAFTKLRTRRVEREKQMLEMIVAERTQELVKKNKKITDSIKYAQRIQEAVLPVKEGIRDLLPSSFILFKPKDIVSGDFYWFTKKENLVIITAVDCTGHGVPGAFMSLIGSNLLNDIIGVQGIVNPVDILKAMHRGVIDTLKKDTMHSETVDGMDMAICTIDLKEQTLEYAGAGCPLLLIKDGKSELIKGNNHPIGLTFGNKGQASVYESNGKLQSHKTKLSKDDTFYIFSDGYCDQFGGEDNSKFMGGRFKDLLMEIQPKAMSNQETLLDKNIENWRGDSLQIDDILVIGVRI
ncbi:MAG: SpoIIE family protein phosphatase [Flavobacteriales bacterium]|nr:SpoIIE family protein phosphatase [Flavobacteriales bacterium]